ncbi:MAG: hypothetical protein IPQ08_09165 [Chitinophagaceae bacterium]|nr:hypothetical protein [Chitinophagaceae bacterium]
MTISVFHSISRENKVLLRGHIRTIKRDHTWEITNKTIYGLCKKYPDHEKTEEIVAKVIIIGRVYAAALERGKATRHGKGDNFYRIAVPAIMRKFFSSPVTKNIIAKIRNKNTPEDAIHLHNQLMKRLKPLRKMNKVSFVSKYLHFHFPKSYYIYDSRANVGLPIVEKLFDRRIEINKTLKKTTKYGQFYTKSEFARNLIQKSLNIKLSHREFDSLLLFISSKVKKTRCENNNKQKRS